jgi:hypothetical protein
MTMSPRRALLGRRPRRDATSLRDHPLLGVVLDPQWYATRYRDVFRFGAGPVEHFLRSGIREGRDPGPFVDLSYYATQVSPPPGTGPELLAHLLDIGVPTGIRTSPYVDLAWYAHHHPGVPEDPTARFEHLMARGVPSGCGPSPFLDLSWYRGHYRDIMLGGLDAFAYFVALGGPLRRFPHPIWDEDAYCAENEYVRFALGMGKYLHGFEHFCAVGHREVARGSETLVLRLGERAEEYSEDRYLAANPDVADAVSLGRYESGVAHLFAEGHREVASGDRPLRLPWRRSRITTATSFPAPASDTLMIMVHFDPLGTVDPHVVTAVDTYVDAGIDVCAVTVELGPEASEPLLKRCIAVLDRDENDDLRDFGAWALALDAIGEHHLDAYERVILANDSTYFPACDPAPFLEALQAQTCDIWAASDSFSGGRYHLQSYFLALSRRGRRLLTPELARRTRQHPSPTKLSLIQHFEIGLTQHALQEGLEVGCFRSVKDLDPTGGALADLLSPPDARDLSPLLLTITNQMHHFWRAALRSGLPFLKVELLRDNPLDVDISGWRAEIDGAACTATIVRSHLDRVAPGGWAGSDLT